MSFEIINNTCEICKQKATGGILDESDPIKIRYTCQDHYIQVYELIKKKINKWPLEVKKSYIMVVSFHK